MQATSDEPGALPVDQLPTVCHRPSPAPPVQLSVQLGGSANALAGKTTNAPTRTTAPRRRAGSRYARTHRDPATPLRFHARTLSPTETPSCPLANCKTFTATSCQAVANGRNLSLSSSREQVPNDRIMRDWDELF